MTWNRAILCCWLAGEGSTSAGRGWHRSLLGDCLQTSTRPQLTTATACCVATLFGCAQTMSAGETGCLCWRLIGRDPLPNPRQHAQVHVLWRHSRECLHDQVAHLSTCGRPPVLAKVGGPRRYAAHWLLVTLRRLLVSPDWTPHARFRSAKLQGLPEKWKPPCLNHCLLHRGSSAHGHWDGRVPSLAHQSCCRSPECTP